MVQSDVQAEFDDLQRSRITAQQCYECEKTNAICTHPLPTITDKFRDLLRRRSLKPLFLIATLSVLSRFGGNAPYRPYIVQVLYYYESPIDPNTAIVWMGYIGFVSIVVLMLIIRSFGKRTIYLWSLAINTLISFGLGKQFRFFF